MSCVYECQDCPPHPITARPPRWTPEYVERFHGGDLGRLRQAHVDALCRVGRPVRGRHRIAWVKEDDK